MSAPFCDQFSPADNNNQALTALLTITFWKWSAQLQFANVLSNSSRVVQWISDGAGNGLCFTETTVAIYLEGNNKYVKHRNNLGCLNQYVYRGLRLWDSRDHEAVSENKYMQRMENMKQSG